MFGFRGIQHHQPRRKEFTQKRMSARIKNKELVLGAAPWKNQQRDWTDV